MSLLAKVDHCFTQAQPVGSRGSRDAGFSELPRQNLLKSNFLESLWMELWSKIIIFQKKFSEFFLNLAKCDSFCQNQWFFTNCALAASFSHRTFCHIVFLQALGDIQTQKKNQTFSNIFSHFFSSSKFSFFLKFSNKSILKIS